MQVGFEELGFTKSLVKSAKATNLGYIKTMADKVLERGEERIWTISQADADSFCGGGSACAVPFEGEPLEHVFVGISPGAQRSGKLLLEDTSNFVGELGHALTALDETYDQYLGMFTEQASQNRLQGDASTEFITKSLLKTEDSIEEEVYNAIMVLDFERSISGGNRPDENDKHVAKF